MMIRGQLLLWLFNLIFIFFEDTLHGSFTIVLRCYLLSKVACLGVSSWTDSLAFTVTFSFNLLDWLCNDYLLLLWAEILTAIHRWYKRGWTGKNLLLISSHVWVKRWCPTLTLKCTNWCASWHGWIRRHFCGFEDFFCLRSKLTLLLKTFR